MAMVLLLLGRALSFSLLSLLFVGSSALAQSFVRLNSEHRLEVPLSYEKLLGRLEGEDASRSMFLSQQVQLIEYLPRKEKSVEPSNDSNVADRSSSQAHEPKVNRAVIDILGQSCEFGWMRYVMSISAGEERTSIAVDLVQPAGMLVGQSYQFQIQPIDDHHCSVQISHRLDVKLIQRRLDLVNSIIRQVTCKEASRQIGILTRAMAHCLLEIATQPPSKSKAPATDKKPEKKAESTKSESAKPDLLDDSDSQSSAPRLRIKIRVAETGKGAIRVALFSTKEQFSQFDARKEEAKQGEAYRKKEFKVEGDSVVVCEFKDVEPGRYVIAAFHDLDSNQKLNASFLGLPSEPYGFSRDARGQLGTPKYEDAEIKFEADHAEFSFSLK